MSFSWRCSTPPVYSGHSFNYGIVWQVSLDGQCNVIYPNMCMKTPNLPRWCFLGCQVGTCLPPLPYSFFSQPSLAVHIVPCPLLATATSIMNKCSQTCLNSISHNILLVLSTNIPNVIGKAHIMLQWDISLCIKREELSVSIPHAHCQAHFCMGLTGLRGD